MQHNKTKRIISFLSGIVVIAFFAYVIITNVFVNNNDTKENKDPGSKDSVKNINIEESDETDYEEYFKNYTGELTYIEKPKFQYDVDNKVPAEDNPYGYTQEENDFSSYVSYKETAGNYIYKNEGWKDYPLSKDKVKNIGEKILMYDRMEYITVNSIKFYDNVNELKKDDFFDKSDLAFKSESDGSFRQIYSQEDGGKGNLKLAVLNITIESNHPWVSELSVSNLFCVGMMKEEDDGYHIVNTTNHYYFLDKNGEKEWLYVSGNSRMYAPEYAAYYDGAIFRSALNRDHFFGNFVGKGETMTFNYGFWVDESRKDEIYLFHSYNCTDGVYPDSICEFAVKVDGN